MRGRTSATPTSWSLADVYARTRRPRRRHRPVSGRHRRLLTEERAGGRSGRRAHTPVRRRARRPLRRPWPSPWTCRSTTSSAPAPTSATPQPSSACGGPAPPPATSTSAPTRATTAWAASSSTPRPISSAGCCPEHGTPHRAGRRGELVLPSVRLPGPPRAARRIGRAGDHSPSRSARRFWRSLRRGVEDISVSRSVARARGWGIGVPDDPTQVIYVWFDALTNYISSLASAIPQSGEYRRWWLESTGGCTSSARASCASTPCTGLRSSPRPASPRRLASRSTPT